MDTASSYETLSKAEGDFSLVSVVDQQSNEIIENATYSTAITTIAATTETEIQTTTTVVNAGESASVEIQESRASLLGSVTIFAVIGVLTRIGLNRLFNYSAAPVPFTVLPQFVGCFFIGLLIRHKSAISIFSHATYVGFATGFCGSLTTFSSLMATANQQLFNIGAGQVLAQRNVFFDILAYGSVILVGFSASFSGYFLGSHFGAVLKPAKAKAKVAVLKYAKPVFCLRERTSPISSSKQENRMRTFAFVLEYFYVVFSLLLLAALIIVAINVSDQQQLVLAAIFVPVGATLRWYLGVMLNKKYRTFPLGTFLANIGASLLLATLFVLSKSLPGNSITTCNVLTGLSDGFCGGLSTVSTFIAELFVLKRRFAYRYFSATVFAAQIGMIAVYTPYVVLVLPQNVTSCQ